MLTTTVICGFLCFLSQGVVNAQLTILHNFADGTVSPDAARPTGGLIQAPDGTFYGVASGHSGSSGAERTGDVFQFTVAGNVKILHDFPHRQLLSPFGPLFLYKRDLIGVCYNGPKWNGGGAVFRLKFLSDTGSWQMILLHRFSATLPGDGASPNSPVSLGSDGNFYGTTAAGGIHDGGTIFSLDPNNHAFSVLHRFNQKGEGISPGAPLLLASDGNYYGTTTYGPGYNVASGTIFMMTPARKMTTLYTFPFDAIDASALIQDSAGNFYGSTFGGGSSQFGTVFKMAPDHTVTILHSFGQAPDGAFPSGVVVGPNGNLYGTTSAGGTANRGTIFELSTDGSSYTVLHNFADGSITNDGITPSGGLILGLDNNFYGITGGGGSANRGTIFKLSP